MPARVSGPCTKPYIHAFHKVFSDPSCLRITRGRERQNPTTHFYAIAKKSLNLLFPSIPSTARVSRNFLVCEYLGYNIGCED